MSGFSHGLRDGAQQTHHAASQVVLRDPEVCAALIWGTAYACWSKAVWRNLKEGDPTAAGRGDRDVGLALDTLTLSNQTQNPVLPPRAPGFPWFRAGQCQCTSAPYYSGKLDPR